jgi:hypothetical protein
MKHAIVFRSSGDIGYGGTEASERTGSVCLLALPLFLHLLLNSAGQLATCRQRMLAQVTSQRNLVVSDDLETSGGSARRPFSGLQRIAG